MHGLVRLHAPRRTAWSDCCPICESPYAPLLNFEAVSRRLNRDLRNFETPDKGQSKAPESHVGTGALAGAAAGGFCRGDVSEGTCLRAKTSSRFRTGWPARAQQCLAGNNP